MKALVNNKLKGIPVRATKAALEAFKENLPESMFRYRKEEDDKEWYKAVQFKEGIDVAQYKDIVSQEFLAATKPVAEAMMQVLERAFKSGDSLNKETLKKIAIEVASTQGITGLRRGLFALGLVESAELGFEAAGMAAGASAAGTGASTAAGTAGAGTGATAAAGASLAVPLAIVAGGILVAVTTALCLKAAKDYKVSAARQAGYMVASSEDAIRARLIESTNFILDWFQEGIERRLHQLLGLRRAESAQYQLAVQCERISLLRSATLKALQEL
jgi:hypothetical protein